MIRAFVARITYCRGSVLYSTHGAPLKPHNVRLNVRLNVRAEHSPHVYEALTIPRSTWHYCENAPLNVPLNVKHARRNVLHLLCNTSLRVLTRVDVHVCALGSMATRTDLRGHVPAFTTAFFPLGRAKPETLPLNVSA